MVRRLGNLIGGVGGAIALLYVFGSMGSTAAVAYMLGWRAYPIFFAVNMLLSSVVLLVPDFIPWLKAKILCLLVGFGYKPKPPKPVAESVAEGSYSKGLWAWLRRRGAIYLITAVALSPAGSAGAATLARAMRLNDRKTWKYVLIANVVTTAFWISLYVGDWPRIWSGVLYVWGLVFG